MDGTGNTDLRLSRPALVIVTDGADRDPDPKPASGPTLRGPRAWALMRTLAEVRPPYSAGDLAASVAIDKGYVSKVLQALVADRLIECEPRRPVTGGCVGGTAPPDHVVVLAVRQQRDVDLGGIERARPVARRPRRQERSPLGGERIVRRIRAHLRRCGDRPPSSTPTIPSGWRRSAGFCRPTPVRTWCSPSRSIRSCSIESEPTAAIRECPSLRRRSICSPAVPACQRKARRCSSG
jgi:hypothetical protein